MSGGPVAGAQRRWVSLGSDPLDVGAYSAFVADPSAGCSVTFTGTVRDHSTEHTGVTMLSYEAYEGVAEAKIGEIVDEAFGRWPLMAVAVGHRIGDVALGEPTVVVAVSSAHRVDAFPAARHVIDELKARVPIWKKEHWEGGAEWSPGA